MNKYVWKLKYSSDQPRVPEGQSGGGQWTSEGEGIMLSLNQVADKISAAVPKGQTYRGISKHRFDAVRNGEDLISIGAEMLAQAGKPGELQVTDNLLQALAHAEGGVLIALPRKLTAAWPQFRDIRKVKGDRLTLIDITMAFDAKTGEVIYKA